MNYLAQINAFYIWLLENPLSGNAQALWHRLMAYNNQFAWREEFSLANDRLAREINISRQELDRIRNVLVQKGRIKYIRGGAGRAGRYHLIPFVPHYAPPAPERACNNMLHSSLHDTLQGTLQGALQDTLLDALPLNKLNQTKQNKTKQLLPAHAQEAVRCAQTPPTDFALDGNVLEAYRANIGSSPSQVECDHMRRWLEVHTPQDVIEAIRQAAKYNGRNAAYIDRVLAAWGGKGAARQASEEPGREAPGDFFGE